MGIYGVRRVATAIAFLVPLAVVAADPKDPPEARKAAAERYVKVADVPKLFRDTVDGMAPNLPTDQQAAFRSLMIKNLRVEVVEVAMALAMTKHFTTAELNALTDFYGSDMGRSILNKFGAYMGDVTPLLQAELAHALASYQKQRASPRQQ